MDIYEITIKDIINNPKMGIQAVSLVDYPAVERDFLKFKKDTRAQKRLMLSETQEAEGNEEKRTITGVALLADTPIYRWDFWRGEYLIVFKRATIAKLVEKYSRDGLFNMVNLQHDEMTYTTQDCTLLESYLVDKERGVCPKEFADVPDGSWMVTYRVNNPELWEQIKTSGELNGFSIEVLANIMPMVDTSNLEAPIGVPDYEEEDWEWDYRARLRAALGLEKKKFEVSKDEVRKALKEKKQVEIQVDDKRTVVGQIKDLGTRDGKPIVNVYVPKADRWYTYEIGSLKGMTITELPLEPWNYDAPGFKEIQDDDSNVVTDSITADRESIIYALENRLPVMIRYNDEDESKGHDSATGARQIEIVCYGYSLAGNECFRAYQHYGDTSSESPAWKLFLTKRCLNFKIMKEAEPYGVAGGPGDGGYHINDVDIPNIIAQLPETQSIFPNK